MTVISSFFTRVGAASKAFWTASLGACASALAETANKARAICVVRFMLFSPVHPPGTILPRERQRKIRQTGSARFANSSFGDWDSVYRGACAPGGGCRRAPWESFGWGGCLVE